MYSFYFNGIMNQRESSLFIAGVHNYPKTACTIIIVLRSDTLYIGGVCLLVDKLLDQSWEGMFQKYHGVLS